MSGAGAAMLFDFPELFDPLTLRILEFLAQFDRVAIHEIQVQRSKDREARDNPRNRKRMVHIQYQESVHCIAFALNLLAHCRGSVEAVFDGGVAAQATAVPYDPPNPEDYPYVVDGRCDYELALGGATLRGCTDFKRGARWEKSRLIRGLGDGREFVIEADYLEGAKYLRLDGVDQGMDPDGSSYTGVLTTLDRWVSTAGRDGLVAGLFPNPAFTRLTYQLSSLVWRSCFEGGARLQLGSASELVAFQAGFAEAASRFGRY
ncbi:MAG: hypothetical protein ABIL09_09320 [Gemmatimonadota bacterium]